MPMMSHESPAPVVRPTVPSRFRRGHTRRSVEILVKEISDLTMERQRLRDAGVDGTRLERNRVRLARKQWELSHALIERHLPSDSQAA
jgi:hypothetical protein